MECALLIGIDTPETDDGAVTSRLADSGSFEVADSVDTTAETAMSTDEAHRRRAQILVSGSPRASF